MEKKSFNFKTQCASVREFLNPVESPIRLLLGKIFDAEPEKMELSTLADDLRGTDILVPSRDGSVHRIDVKVRTVDYCARTKSPADVALELWSVMEKKKIGWTLNRESWTDSILTYWQDTKRVFVVPFVPLLEAFEANKEYWSRIYKTDIQHTEPETHNGRKTHCRLCNRLHVAGGYHSKVVFVPIATIVEAVQVFYPRARFYPKSSMSDMYQGLLLKPWPAPFLPVPSEFINRQARLAVDARPPERVPQKLATARELNYPPTFRYHTA